MMQLRISYFALASTHYLVPYMHSHAGAWERDYRVRSYTATRFRQLQEYIV